PPGRGLARAAVGVAQLVDIEVRPAGFERQLAHQVVEHELVEHHHARMLQQAGEGAVAVNGEARRQGRVGAGALLDDQLDLALLRQMRKQLGAVVGDPRLHRGQGAEEGDAHGVGIVVGVRPCGGFNIMQTCIMLSCIMIFVNRLQEMERLDRLSALEDGGLAVVYGRRRIGKTRLLLHWSSRHHGLYTVADQSSADIQRRYFAEAVAERLPGFADVDYRDWRTLLLRLAREAAAAGWRGPIILDELPYFV